MKRKILIFLLVLGLGVGTAPRNSGAVSSTIQPITRTLCFATPSCQQHLIQLQKSYTQITTTQPCLADGPVRQEYARSLPSRYFHNGEMALPQHLWEHSLVDDRHQHRRAAQHQHRLPEGHNTSLSIRSVRTLGNGCLRTRTCSVPVRVRQLVDGANINAMATIGSIRGNAQSVQTQIANLEQDSFSGDPESEYRSLRPQQDQRRRRPDSADLQDSNKLLASLVEQQTILAKQQRDATTNAINADIRRQASLAGNLAQVTGTMTDSLQNFRMP